MKTCIFGNRVYKINDDYEMKRIQDKLFIEYLRKTFKSNLVKIKELEEENKEIEAKLKENGKTV